MKTRSLLLSVILILLLFVTGCSSQDSVTGQSDSGESDTKSASQTQSEVDFNGYDTYKFETYDSNTGYKFECTVHCTPWIPTTDTETLDIAWQKFSQGHEFPSADYANWDLEEDSTGWYQAPWDGTGAHTGELFVGSTADIYYMIGDISFRNITGGDWHLSESNPSAPSVSLLIDTEHHECTMGRTFYASKEKLYDNAVYCKPHLVQDGDDPMAFVYAFFNTKNPKHPDGYYTGYLDAPLKAKIYEIKDGVTYNPTIDLTPIE